MFLLMASSSTAATVKPLSTKPVITMTRARLTQALTISGCRIQKRPPRESSATWKQKNFTAKPEEEMPAGTPRFLKANTCMGWPPVAAGVTLE